jgi:hypothetical protein
MEIKIGIYAYREGIELAKHIDFYPALVAAMILADTDNAAALKRAFPEAAAELQTRYDAPGGLLPFTGERDLEGRTREDLDEIRRQMGLPT